MQVAQDAPLKPFMDVFAIGWAFSVISFFLETTLPSKIIVFQRDSGLLSGTICYKINDIEN